MNGPALLEVERTKFEQRYQKLHEANTSTQSESIFQTQSFAKCIQEAAKRPPARKLAGPLLMEGELVLGFGDTGTGKTALGVQFANDIACGRTSTGLEVESDSLQTLLIDFELSDSQHAQRYSIPMRNIGYTDLYEFSDGFLRAEISAANIRRSFDANKWHEVLLNEIEQLIVGSKAAVTCLDNITWLAAETEKQKFALPLMQRLNEIKKRPPGQSILVWAHTPKRDDSKPLSINDLAGSKTLANFADSVFAIGRSFADTSLRYIKQLKVRSGPLVYDANNVALFHFEKPDNFLGFTYAGQSREAEHLKSVACTAKGDLMIKARELRDQGKSQREIARELAIAPSTVNKYLRRVDDLNTCYAPREEINFPPGSDVDEINERWAIEHEEALT